MKKITFLLIAFSLFAGCKKGASLNMPIISACIDFKSHAALISEMGESNVDSANVIEKCPDAGQKASCDYSGKPDSSKQRLRYYSGMAAEKLASAESSCKENGGVWQKQ